MAKREAKKKKKSGQISVFIIIAILIIAAIAVVILYRENVFNTGKDRVAPEVQPIYSFIEGCIKSTAENDIYYIGQTGGYFTSPEKSIEYGIAYYYDKGENLMPTKERIEKEIADYMNFMLPFCTQDFTDYPDFKVKTDDAKTVARIKEGKVVFSVKYPLTITKGNKNYFFENFGNTQIQVRLNKVYQLANNITQDAMKNKNNICLTCMNAEATALDLYVEYNDYSDNESIVFTIRDANSKILDMDYRFNFANKYEK